MSGKGHSSGQLRTILALRVRQLKQWDYITKTAGGANCLAEPQRAFIGSDTTPQAFGILGESLRMTPGGIYAHIGSKEELLLAVYAEGVERIGTHVKASVLSAGQSPISRFRAALTAQRGFLVDRR